MAIETESWWKAETVPPSLVSLISQLQSYWGIPFVNFGTKGNVFHTRGYHRSFNWVRNSAFSTNRTYSVSETSGNRNPPDKNWVSALDVTLPTDLLLPACQRLDQATRSGGLEKVTEWYGNMDGDTRVDGYDNIRNVVSSSDVSHLWHVHMSFDRGRVNENHSDVFAILTGVDMAEVYYRIKSADPTYNGKVFVSNRVHRRGPIRSPGSIQKSALAGATEVVLTDDMLHGVSATETWDTYLDAIAGPVAPTGGLGLTDAQVRDIVRQELDKTKLGQG